MRHLSLAAMLVLVFTHLSLVPTSAEPIGKHAFKRTWERTDLPVAELRVSRTWMWGQEAFTTPLYEEYAEADGGVRVVQYFDKSRMEITDPNADPADLWYVTNGLLARELITGAVQVGEDVFEQHEPAHLNLAGDTDDPDGPTYASFSRLMSYEPIPEGWLITQTVNSNGEVGNREELAENGVSAGHYVPETNHRVASVFWAFMTSQGMVYEGGAYPTSSLFQNPFYGTGLPLTEAYWVEDVLVGGQPKLVLIQIFERRVLTYTPDNPEGWQVEAGNVGLHYYTWRYQQLGESSQPAPSDPPPSCVNINLAPKDELKRIVHIGDSRAEQLIWLRPFTSIDDLDRVPGIGGTRITDIKEQGLACL